MIERKTLSYLDFRSVEEVVEKKCDKDVRNWAGTSYKLDDPNYNQSHRDFWHKLLEVYESNRFHNDCYIQISFQAIWQYFKDKKWSDMEWAYAKPAGVDLNQEWIWIKEICDLFEQVLTESGIYPDDPDEKAYNFHIWW